MSALPSRDRLSASHAGRWGLVKLARWVAMRVLGGEQGRVGSTTRRQATLVTHWARKHRHPRQLLDIEVRRVLNKWRE